ncbi:tetratricopeptide repeat protein [Flavobacterium phragmitis]|uniref:Tetratricopeptide repeat-containing protein n=1 Tax=Flavobacterium phragmitis TaxID=739143 RepID=A0A1I1TIT8_9FLAO|nr:tetratricopeptide repeat protein [Flavobacterium phragmitis]SFD58546.1 Tetratricopeptide repeat-containing protein [Flavobacterium phragmitis]
MSAKKIYFVVLFLHAFLINAQELQINSSKNYLRDIESILKQEKNFGRDTTSLRNYLQPLNHHPKYEVIYLGLLANGFSNAHNSLNKTSDSYYINAIQKAKSSKNVSLEIWSKLNYINYLYYYRDYIKLTPFLLQLMEKIEPVAANQIITAAETYKRIGWILYTFGDYNKSLHYLRLAEKTAAKNTSDHASIMNSIGMNYFNIGNHKMASFYLNETAKLSKKIHDDVRYAKALGDLALISQKKGDYKKAIALLKEDIQISEQNKSDQNTMYASILLAEVLVKDKQLEEAFVFLNKAESIAISKSYFKKSELQIIKLKLQILKLQDSTENELNLRRRMIIIEDSLQNEDGDIAIKKANWLIQKAKFQQNIDTAEKAVKYETTLRYFYIIIFMMLFSAVLLVFMYFSKQYKSRHLRYEEKVKSLELEKLKIEENLSKVHENLKSQISYLKEKNIQIKNLKLAIENVKNSSSSYIEKRERKLSALLESHLMTDNNWNAFRREFQKEYPEFYALLQKKFPEITDSNKRILLLQKLDFSNNEIAELLGITNDAVKKSKQRLKKKLGDKYDSLFNPI